MTKREQQKEQAALRQLTKLQWDNLRGRLQKARETLRWRDRGRTPDPAHIKSARKMIEIYDRKLRKLQERETEKLSNVLRKAEAEVLFKPTNVALKEVERYEKLVARRCKKGSNS